MNEVRQGGSKEGIDVHRPVSLPRRGCTPKPRVALRAPWVSEDANQTTSKGLDNGDRCPTLSGWMWIRNPWPRVREARPWALES